MSKCGKLATGLALVLGQPCGLAHSDPAEVARHISLVDSTRSVKAVAGFAGSSVRRVDVTVWSPAEAGKAGKHPLVIYSHGAFGRADNAMYLVHALVNAGYIVAAPDYPLSSSAAYTAVKAADATDVVNQTRDVRFIIDRLLADPALSSRIDVDAIATVGHSLGAVTSYFTSFATGVRDPRIKATVLMGAGDPVQAALSANMGMNGTWYTPVHVPVLFLSAQHDAIARFTGPPLVAYTRLEAPKYEVTVRGGAHVWFADAAGPLANGGNPDCAMFGSGAHMIGCEAGVKMTTPARQHEITSIAVRDFLDGYLKNDKARLEQLRGLPATMPDVDEHAVE